MGSICDARRAGTTAAMIDTVSNRSVAQTAVSGSAPPRPYNMDPIKRTIQSAAPNPNSIPTSVTPIRALQVTPLIVVGVETRNHTISGEIGDRTLFSFGGH
jgi:hypothetical protein